MSALMWLSEVEKFLSRDREKNRDSSLVNILSLKTSAPILAPRHSGPNAKTVRTIGPDTSVLGPRHFGTIAKVSRYSASEHMTNLLIIIVYYYCDAR